MCLFLHFRYIVLETQGIDCWLDNNYTLGQNVEMEILS